MDTEYSYLNSKQGYRLINLKYLKLISMFMTKKAMRNYLRRKLSVHGYVKATNFALEIFVGMMM